MVMLLKKTILWGITFIGLGFFIGDLIFNNRELILNSISKRGEPYYFLQEGVYSDKQILENNLTSINIKTIDYNNDKFYVYLGITKNKEVAEKLKAIYKEKGYPVIIKEKHLENEEFSNNVTQFDLLINATKEEDEILTIEEVVLANYDELIKYNSKN